MLQNSHRGDVVHAVRQYMELLVTVEPVKGEATHRRVVYSPLSLIPNPRQN